MPCFTASAKNIHGFALCLLPGKFAISSYSAAVLFLQVILDFSGQIPLETLSICFRFFLVGGLSSAAFSLQRKLPAVGYASYTKEGKTAQCINFTITYK